MDVAKTPLQITITPPEKTVKPSSFWEGESPSFQDLLDTINPLQHIPIVSNIYQSLTGDSASTGAKIAGDTLFGGALGFIGSIINQIVETETGTDIGGNLLSAITGTPANTSAHIASSDSTNTPAPRYISASRQNAYNAYVSVQSA